MNFINRQVLHRLLEVKFEHFSNTLDTEKKRWRVRERERERGDRVGLWFSW